MTAQNPDLVAVSASLNALANRIHERKASVADPAAYAALNGELMEINHRIVMVGALIFSARSEAIVTAAKKVAEGKAVADYAIERVEKLNKFFKKIAAFLALVDDVIDVAKKVALA